MKQFGYLSLLESAEFLKISRPTFNKRRKELALAEIKEGNATLLNKASLLDIYAKEHTLYATYNFVVTEDDQIDDLLIDRNTFDLRKINVIDAYGAISLLIASIEIIEKEKAVYFIISDSVAVSTLCVMGFFQELERRFENKFFYNGEGYPKNTARALKVFLPIKYIAYRGQERQFIETLEPLLTKQGFEQDTIGYLGWMIGEVADNALTHAQGPCYILIGQFGKQNNFLQVSIGDVGKGIYGSLKENPKYSNLSDNIAFIKAFQSMVSCWPDDKPRGKGLSDVLSMAMGSGSLLRVDSKNRGLLFNFINGQKELIKKKPTTELGGTRFCWVLINNHFKKASRQDIDDFILREIGNNI